MEFVITAAIDELAAVQRPARLGPAVHRDLAFAAGARERPHVDLVAARLVGGVGQPATVGRDHGRALVELGDDEGLRLGIGAGRQRVDAPAPAHVGPPHDHRLTVGHPRDLPLRRLSSEQQLGRTAAVGEDPEQIPDAAHPVTTCREHDPPPVRRPLGVAVVALERHAGHGAFAERVEPDVSIAALLPGQGQATPVRRDPRAFSLHQRRQHGLLDPVSIHGDQRKLGRQAAHVGQGTGA